MVTKYRGDYQWQLSNILQGDSDPESDFKQLYQVRNKSALLATRGRMTTRFNGNESNPLSSSPSLQDS